MWAVFACFFLVPAWTRLEPTRSLPELRGPGFEGNLTASGDVLEPNIEYTAAHPYVPFGTDLYVCYASCVWVEVTDRGPYVGGRDLDLSYAAAEEIRLTGVG